MEDMISKLKVGSTILVMCLSFMSFSNFDIIVSAILILSFGLVHGACDIALITTKLKTSSLKVKSGVILLYIILAFGSFFIVFKLPLIGFIVFLFISSYHFGEQHFHLKLKNSKIRFWQFLFYGLLIFMLMIETHEKMVLEVLSTLLDYKIEGFPIQLILFLSMSMTFFLWAMDYKKIEFSIPKELFNLLIIYLLFYTTSLMVSFATYFVVWHSIPSILDQISFLHKEVSAKTILLYLKKSGFYWAISIAGLVFLISFKDIMGEDFYLIIYSFMVSITIPHMVVINNILSKPNCES